MIRIHRIASSLLILGFLGILNISAQNVVLEGPVYVDGLLTLKQGFEVITGYNQMVNINSRAYIKITIGNQFIIQPFIRLSDGEAPGQMLMLQCTGFLGGWQLDDNSDDSPFPGPVGNINLPQNRIFFEDDIIQLVWTGDEWLEIHFKDN
jgi:hypothetical protein